MDPRLTPAAHRKLRCTLLAWYDEHRRELPWRRDADPYRVWLSEIMLQQTRVAAVVDHYSRFLKKFPTVQALAAAREASVLAVWSGLGYYHRARRMHQAAKLIARKRRGRFPRTSEEWRQLPGIGRYTAAAIASIAFSEPVAVVDGNVERVLERMFGAAPGREAAWQRAESLLDRERPGDFNQAMMELGATVCTPRAPQCLVCPLHRWCVSRGAELTPPQPARKRKQLIYGLARQNGCLLLVQRSANASLMAGMWELPTLSEAQHNGDEPAARLRHSITDTDYEVSVFTAAPATFRAPAVNGRWFARRQWERLPLTGLARKILRRLLV
jgi:A/G-specific adenine glycosylase